MQAPQGWVRQPRCWGAAEPPKGEEASPQPCDRGLTSLAPCSPGDSGLLACPSWDSSPHAQPACPDLFPDRLCLPYSGAFGTIGSLCLCGPPGGSVEQADEALAGGRTPPSCPSSALFAVSLGAESFLPLSLALRSRETELGFL